MLLMLLMLLMLVMLHVLGMLGMLRMLGVLSSSMLSVLLVLCVLEMLGMLSMLWVLLVLLMLHVLLLRVLRVLLMLGLLGLLQLLVVLLVLRQLLVLRVLRVLLLCSLLLLSHEGAVVLLNLVPHRLLVQSLREVVNLVRLLHLAISRNRCSHLWGRRTGASILKACDLQWRRWCRAGEDVVSIRRRSLLRRMESLVGSTVREGRRRFVGRGILLLREATPHAIDAAKREPVRHSGRRTVVVVVVGRPGCEEGKG